MTRAARLVLGTVVAALALPGSAAAADITVTSTADPAVNNGACTLREAISAANADDSGPNNGCPTPGSGADRILLAPGTYALGVFGPGEDVNAAGDLDITSPIEIVGAGAGSTTIDASGVSDRILELPDPAAVVTIRDLKLTGGLAPVGGHGATVPGQPNIGTNGLNGTAGGAIASEGDLTLQSVDITDNRSGFGGDGGDGGAPGAATGNGNGPSSLGGNGGRGGDGGALDLRGGSKLQATDVLFRDNVAAPGGDGGTSANAAAGGNGGASSGGNGGNSEGGDGGDGGRGGAIWAVDSEVTLTRVQIISNDSSRGGFGGGFGTPVGDGGPGGTSTGSTGGAGGSSVGGNGGQGGDGAGIAQTRSELTVEDSRLSENTSGPGGFAGSGGPGGNGGTGSSATAPGGNSRGGSGGSAGGNAAIFSIDVTVGINRSTIDKNDASPGGDGGGAAAAGAPDGSASGGSGGVGGFTGGVSLSGGTLGFSNSTLSGNRSGRGGSGGASPGGNGGTGGNGGGRTAIAIQGGGTAALVHLTIADNETGLGAQAGTGATAGNAGVDGFAGAISSGSNVATLKNSIVANNDDIQCDADVAVTSAGNNNLVFPAADPKCPAERHGNPLLGPLADNGGDAPTRALGAGSAALDQFAADCASTDQREVLRPRGSACDIGAYERAAPLAATGGASAISRTGAKLAGTASPNTRPTTYRFAYGTSTSYNRFTPPVNVSSGTAGVAAAATLSGLQPGTTYHYRLEATNGDGTTRGADRTFKTAAAPVVPTTPTTPITPTPIGTLPAPFSGVGVRTRSARSDRRGRISVKLACPAAAVGTCRGRLTLKARVRRKTLTFGSARFSIGQGKSKTVRLKLSRKGRTALRRSRRLTGSLSVSATDSRGGKAKTTKRRLGLRAPRR